MAKKFLWGAFIAASLFSLWLLSWMVPLMYYSYQIVHGMGSELGPIGW